MISTVDRKGTLDPLRDESFNFVSENLLSDKIYINYAVKFFNYIDKTNKLRY